MACVTTDERSRVVLPGHPNETFLLREYSDGSVLLDPASIASEAYHDVLTACGLIFEHPGRPPLKVFWTTNGAGDGPRAEAVLDRS